MAVLGRFVRDRVLCTGEGGVIVENGMDWNFLEVVREREGATKVEVLFFEL